MSSPHDFGSPVADIEDYLASAPEPSPPPPDDEVPSATPPQRRRPWRTLIVGLVLVVASATALGGWWMAPGAPAGDGTDPTTVTPPGIGGFAEMFIATYLTEAGHGADDALDSFMADPPDIAAMTPMDRYVPRAAAIDIAPLGANRWAVTVAAHVLERTPSGYVSAGVDYYQVAVANSGERLAVAALPARVAAPPTPVEPETPILGEEPSAEILVFTAEFLDALLVGTHRLSRYTVPGASIWAVEPHPYGAITIVGAVTGMVRGTTYVSATIEAETATGTIHVLGYTLELASNEGGEWEVAAIIPGPPGAEPERLAP